MNAVERKYQVTEQGSTQVKYLKIVLKNITEVNCI